MKYAYTSGIFDVFHAGHMDSIMRIKKLAEANGLGLIIGVCTDQYDESFKRSPIFNFEERFKMISTIFTDCKVIEDPLIDYMDSYTRDFYDSYNIVKHYQGGSFPENDKCYEYMISTGGLEFIGRSELCSTSEIISRIRNTELTQLGGTTNRNFLTNNYVVKIIDNGNKDRIKSVYDQLAELEVYKIGEYKIIDNIVFLPHIEGEVSPQSLDRIDELIKDIKILDLEVQNIEDIFNEFDYKPDPEYDKILKDRYICHGDLVYTNVINSNEILIPIDFEYMCKGPKYWDKACYHLSLMLYYSHCYKPLDIIKSLNKEELLTYKLVCEYWLQWSNYTRKYYFNEKLLSFIKLCVN